MSDKKQAVKSSKAQMVEVMTSWFKKVVHKKIIQWPFGVDKMPLRQLYSLEFDFTSPSHSFCSFHVTGSERLVSLQ